MENVQSRPGCPAPLILSAWMHGGPTAPVQESTCKLPCAMSHCPESPAVPKAAAAVPTHTPHPVIVAPCPSLMKELGNSSASWRARDEQPWEQPVWLVEDDTL